LVDRRNTSKLKQQGNQGKWGTNYLMVVSKKKLHMVAMLKNLSLIKEDVLSQ